MVLNKYTDDIQYYVWYSDTPYFDNNKSMAVDMINDIMEYSATRASDFIMQYMPVFAEATGDNRGLNVYDSTYTIINSIVAVLRGV